jgi:hypothetical protein
MRESRRPPFFVMPRPREDCPRGDAFFVGLAGSRGGLGGLGVMGRLGATGRIRLMGVDGQAYRMRRLKK